MPRHASPRAPAPVAVTLPAALVRLFPGSQRHVALAASSVGDLIDALEARWPGMRDRICDSTPEIRRHIRIFVAGERATLGTRLAPGADVIVMTAISGG
jgi:sulfur-carrier protein